MQSTACSGNGINHFVVNLIDFRKIKSNFNWIQISCKPDRPTHIACTCCVLQRRSFDRHDNLKLTAATAGGHFESRFDRVKWKCFPRFCHWFPTCDCVFGWPRMDLDDLETLQLTLLLSMFTLGDRKTWFHFNFSLMTYLFTKFFGSVNCCFCVQDLNSDEVKV